jgi:hypothetical protein
MTVFGVPARRRSGEMDLENDRERAVQQQRDGREPADETARTPGTDATTAPDGAMTAPRRRNDASVPIHGGPGPRLPSILAAA